MYVMFCSLSCMCIPNQIQHESFTIYCSLQPYLKQRDLPLPGTVQISICKASGELHTEDIAIERENSHFRQPHLHLTPANPDEYLRKIYITRHHRL